MPPITFTLTRPAPSPAALLGLGTLWRGMQDAAGASAFQRWVWTGCRAAERFDDPVLVQAQRGGAVVGLALLNRRRGRLWLHESGHAALDAVFIEHNGPVALPGPERAAVLEGVLRCALKRVPWGGVVLSGVGGDTAAAARRVGGAVEHRERAAPYVDLAALPAGADYLGSLSRNTRQQLRRSARAYGPARLDRAATAGEALEFLDGLVRLHTAAWQARGKPGAFADPAVLRFHRELVTGGVPTGEVDLLRIGAGPGVVGYLYNLRAAGRVCAYQGGFDYAGAPPHGKPGLLCHHLAIEAARARGDAAYDFLCGDSRYKDSLATAQGTLHWLRLLPRWHPRVLAGSLLRR